MYFFIQILLSLLLTGQTAYSFFLLAQGPKSLQLTVSAVNKHKCIINHQVLEKLETFEHTVSLHSVMA